MFTALTCSTLTLYLACYAVQTAAYRACVTHGDSCHRN